MKLYQEVFLSTSYGHAQAFSPQHWLHLLAVLVVTNTGDSIVYANAT